MKRLLLLCLVGWGCESPPVFPTQDPRQNFLSSRIEGQVVVTSKARGNAIVFLYDTARPPPPLGSGRPISFSVVSESELFGAASKDTTSGGPFTAPYAFSLVGRGSYLVRAFLDHDECVIATPGCAGPDFNPWYSVTSEPNRGDVGGAAVDALTLVPRVITIADDDFGNLRPATDVQVSISDTALVPADRPAFAVTAGDAIFTAGTAQKILELSPEPLDLGVVHQRQPVFFAKYVDDNDDGVPDDANGDGVGDFWPKVTVRKLKDTPPYLTDENDEDRNGILDSSGADYPLQGAQADGKPDLVVLAAGFDPALVVPALTDGNGNPRLDPVPIQKLRLVLNLRAFDASRSPPAQLAGVPQGRYAIIVQQFTGQSWRIPNELQTAVAPSRGLPSVVTQGFTLTVQP
ncbi:MAG: hypothetical protein ACT4TC_11315 [Myxococcaceae bacterium]